MERTEANARITAALDKLRIMGWTTEQRERLVNGLMREDAVEAAEEAVEQHAMRFNQARYINRA